MNATAEVLGVINSNPGDLAPVFDAMLDKALRLCAASAGLLRSYDGEFFGVLAARGLAPEALAPYHQRVRVSAESAIGRMEQTKRVVHVHDIAAVDYRRDEDTVWARSAAAGVRTLLLVPLLREDTLVGAFTVYRTEVRPFTEKQIALLQNFAAQAVIAMENARLITETREALERQTATAEILRVISSSPTDVKPTFDAIAAAAKTLSDAALSAVLTYDGRLIHWVAAFGWTPDELDKIRGVFPIPPDRGTTVGRAILTRQVAHIADMSTDPEYAYPALAQSGGHTVLAVPMLRDGVPIGAINVQRRRVELFSDKQVDLLKTFADQAVIAIENVRLFNELRDRTADLARSVDELTATGDVLKIISRSTVDLETVLDTLVETVARLCRADH